MPDYYATAEYGTPAGFVHTWSGNVEAANSTEATVKAEKLLRRRCRVQKIWTITVYPPKGAN
jgi:hypothetical protein